MSVWAALWWGAFAAGSLFIGKALANPLSSRERITGLVMGFGAGTLLSAVAYELIPESSLGHGVGIGIGFVVGAFAYYVGDRIVDGAGGSQRQDLKPDEGGSGAAMFVGALLDGIPETFILGITVAIGGKVSIAFLTAVFVSNIPQGVAGTASLRKAGYSDRKISIMWVALIAACAVASALGYLLANTTKVDGAYVEAFAAGAVLTMLADSMMPEGFEHGGREVGLVTVFGYLVASVLTVIQ